MAKTDLDDDMGLTAFFDAAKAERAEPSADLMARIMADAESVAMAREADGRARRAVPKRGIWATLAAAVGGWPAVAGMATATVAGVWLGVAAPAQLTTLTGGLIATEASADYELEAMLPGYGTLAVYEEVAE